jgi:AraC family transcriptional regulator, regulatory protein of adaptative response / DNA-3-methyladenine glycosylase II
VRSWFKSRLPSLKNQLRTRKNEPEPLVVERLPYIAPLDTPALVEFFARRAVPGVEEVVDDTYRRSIRLPHGGGVLELRAVGEQIEVALWLDDPRDRDAAIAHSRALFDLDRDPGPIAAALSEDPIIGKLVRASPGRRVPGVSDPDELAIRTVLGQQVSLAGAATLAGRLVLDCGEPLRSPVGEVTHIFPTAVAISAIGPERLAMPQSRRRAVIGLATALAECDVVLDRDGDHDSIRAALVALPGIGPWTVEYVAMRALRDPDAFLPTDLGVRHALERLGFPGEPRTAAELAEAWRPYRAYALGHLWATLAVPAPEAAPAS